MKTHAKIYPYSTRKDHIRFYKYSDTSGYEDSFNLKTVLLFTRPGKNKIETKIFDTNSSDIMLVTYINLFERL